MLKAYKHEAVPKIRNHIDPWETTRLIGSTCNSRKGFSGGVLIDQSNHQKFWKFFRPPLQRRARMAVALWAIIIFFDGHV
jgi:hypothetical protein